MVDFSAFKLSARKHQNVHKVTGASLLLIFVARFIVGGIADGIEVIVGKTLAVEGIMRVLRRNPWGTLYYQYDLQVPFAEGVCDVRAWPEGAEINKRLVLWYEFRRLGIIIIEAAEVFSLGSCLSKDDGKEQMAVVTLIGSGLHHVVV